MGLSETHQADDLGITDDLFRTVSGQPSFLVDRPAFSQLAGRKGALLHGPYVDLEPGQYQLSFIAKHVSKTGKFSLSSLKIEIMSEEEQEYIAHFRYHGVSFTRPRLMQHTFIVTRPIRRVEIRMFPKGSQWISSIPVVRKAMDR